MPSTDVALDEAESFAQALEAVGGIYAAVQAEVDLLIERMQNADAEAIDAQALNALAEEILAQAVAGVNLLAEPIDTQRRQNADARALNSLAEEILADAEEIVADAEALNSLAGEIRERAHHDWRTWVIRARDVARRMMRARPHHRAPRRIRRTTRARARSPGRQQDDPEPEPVAATAEALR
jgi:hypothetical protein